MRGLIGLVAVLVTVVVEVTVVDRIPFPGSAGPDLVLLAVAAFALASGPLAGALIGFAGGLALDVAPPGSHFVGQQALVFCLVGYLCGLAAQGGFRGRAVLPRAGGSPGGSSPREATEHTALYEIAVMAAAAVFGEALSAALGKMLSDPRVSLPAVRHVLPAAVAYDVLLCPFVLYAAAAVLRMAGALRPAPSAEAARPVGQ
ncbi:MAG: rod shape-determining protein MreD, partial [Streptosporangiaceae bacterium]|nr:rod shape-determining protein MreD [Streptosporangiaceae bacterium]